MYIANEYLAAMAAVSLLAASVSAQTARDIRGPSPLVAIENEPPPRLIVYPPHPEQLALGLEFIQYRTENIRVVPVFGKGALDVSPRIGHLHITVDDLPWHFVVKVFAGGLRSSGQKTGIAAQNLAANTLSSSPLTEV